MLASKPYDRDAALEYARRWALSRNPLFYNFTSVGGNCTSFVSQCVLAGSCVMNFTKDFGWYYISVDDRAPAFTGVEYFWDFFTGAPAFSSVNGGVGPYGREVSRDGVEAGDVVQLGRANGDFYHTLIVTGRTGRDLLVSAHSNDVYNRPLSAYNAPMIRYLHIAGVRFELPFEDCAEALINGVSLPL